MEQMDALIAPMAMWRVVPMVVPMTIGSIIVKPLDPINGYAKFTVTMNGSF